MNGDRPGHQRPWPGFGAAHLRAEYLPALIVAMVCVSFPVAWWALAQGGPGGEEGDIYQEIHELRTVAKDYEAARALALEFFAYHPEKDFLRHQVHYEYAMTFYDERNYDAAVSSCNSISDASVRTKARDLLQGHYTSLPFDTMKRAEYDYHVRPHQ